MDKTTLLAFWEFTRARLLGSLDTIEKSGQAVAKVLAWRPGPGRAHIAWQAMHCAATHDKYVNQFLRGGKPMDEPRIANFGGGSTPSDENVPTLADIRAALASTYESAMTYIRSLSPEALQAKFKMPNGTERVVGETLLLLAWHEAHHQGQIHLTWNLYKAAHGVK
jgi:hypothetical protein